MQSSEFVIEGTKLISYTGYAYHVIVPEGVTEIGEKAFYGNQSLYTIQFPNTLTEIGKLAFCACRSLKRVDFPSSLITIGYTAFAACGALESVAFSEGNKEIKQEVFKGRRSITSIFL